MLYHDELHANLVKRNAYHLELLVSKQYTKIGWDFGMSAIGEESISVVHGIIVLSYAGTFLKLYILNKAQE